MKPPGPPSLSPPGVVVDSAVAGPPYGLEVSLAQEEGFAALGYYDPVLFIYKAFTERVLLGRKRVLRFMYHPEIVADRIIQWLEERPSPPESSRSRASGQKSARWHNADSARSDPGPATQRQ